MIFSKASAGLLVLFLAAALDAQTENRLLNSYERLFVRANLSTKVNVLRDAATDEQASEFYGPLCETALRFVMDHADLFRDDPDMIDIAVFAAKGIGDFSYVPAAETLWQIFLRFGDKVIRFEVLKAIPRLGPGLASKVSRYVAAQNENYRSGISPDYETLNILFSVLAGIGDEQTYPVLFASALLYSGETASGAEAALYAVNGDLRSFLLKTVLESPPQEKLAAFKLFLLGAGTDDAARGEMAETALEAGLAFLGSEGKSHIRELCRLALKHIGETRRSQAFPPVLKYYTQAIAAYKNDPAAKDDCMAAIGCFAFLESAEAAQVLGLQLGLYNSRSFPPDTDNDVVLAIIQALGRLGYKSSYDVLFQAASLSYPDKIREAAHAALQSLQW